MEQKYLNTVKISNYENPQIYLLMLTDDSVKSSCVMTIVSFLTVQYMWHTTGLRYEHNMNITTKQYRIFKGTG